MLSCSPSASQNVKYKAGTLVSAFSAGGATCMYPNDHPVSFVPGVDYSVVTVVDTMGSVAHNTPPRDPQTL